MSGQQKHYSDHPFLLLELMIWHEGYHYRQIKPAPKLDGMPVSDEHAGVGAEVSE